MGLKHAPRNGSQGNERPPGQRTQRNSRKLNRRKTQELNDVGMSTMDIAQHQGVARTTVWRFLQQLKPQQEQLNQFKEHRGDCFAQIQGKALHVQDLALDSIARDFEEKGFTNALTPTAKTKLLHAAVLAGGVAFDKERLAGGQSTQNVSFLSKVILASDQIPSKPLQEKQE